MAVIGADAHVVECERTWEWMEGTDRRYRPTTVHVPTPDGGTKEYWALEDRLLGKGPIAADDVTRAQQEMEDLPARLAHMDKLGVDVQVLFPTFFLTPETTRPEVQVPLFQSYNRWLADVWSRSDNRLRWAVMLPTLDMKAALQELEWSRQNGACAVYMRGVEADGTNPANPLYFELYEAAQALDMPICFHAATGSFDHYDFFPEGQGFWRFKIPGIYAFHQLLMARVPEKFPNLRWGFVELSSQWVPYALHDFVRRRDRFGKTKVNPLTVMPENRFYVSCQLDDDVAYVLSYAGDSNIVMGTDYGHFDNASDLEALTRVKDLPGVSAEQARRITEDNPAALYHV